MEVGVYNCKLIIDFSGVSDYLKELMEEYKEHGHRKGVLGKFMFQQTLSGLTDTLKELDSQRWSEETIFKTILKAFQRFAHLDNFPKGLKSLFLRKVAIVGGIATEMPLKASAAIFDSRILPEVKDVFSVDKKHISGGKWVFDIITIKEVGFSTFKRCLECVPIIKKQMETLKEKKQFSTRYAFRPYALATKLWLEDEASILVQPDLKSFLQGAIRYIFRSEWRTSIVLSAIAVESMLADLYEEKFKKLAPDTPLGDLFRQVKEKIDFPVDAANAVEVTNKARIAAVHRSRFPVSDREAINALYGAANFALWYSSQF